MMQVQLVSEQFSLTTAEEESRLLIDVEREPETQQPPLPELPAGVYRVIAGELYRLVSGAPKAE